MSKPDETMKAYVRMKPITMEEVSVVNSFKNEVSIPKTKELFAFNQVFTQTATNYDIFCQTTLPIIQQNFLGFSSCILAYGQTFSGKTYTMKGQGLEYGIIPLTVKQIFRRITQKGLIAKVKIAYFQIYNENIIDLLSNNTTDDKSSYLEIREDGKKNITINGLIEETVNSEEDSIKFFEKGEQKRKFAANNVNFNSSRSHAIFQIILNIANRNLETTTSHIYMVDLAGSQSLNKTKAQGNLRREGQNINKSLLYLSNVIRQMSQKATYINFRDSKLTRILQNTLNTNNKSVIICTIKQTEESLSETMNTLKFGVTASMIKVNCKRNVDKMTEKTENEARLYEEYASEVKYYREKLQSLQADYDKVSAESKKYKEQKEIIDKKCNRIHHLLIKQQFAHNTNKEVLAQYKNLLENQQRKNLTFHSSENNIILPKEHDINVFAMNTNTYINDIEDQLKRKRQEITLLNQKLQKYRKQITTLQRNERSLVDKVSKYEKQLEILTTTMNKSRRSETNKDSRYKNDENLSQGSGGNNGMRKNTQNTNIDKYEPIQSQYPLNEKGQHPFGFHDYIDVYKPQQHQPEDKEHSLLTLGKVMTLSAVMIDMKRQMFEYTQCNADLQMENNALNQKIIELQEKISTTNQISERSAKRLKNMKVENTYHPNPDYEMAALKKKVLNLKKMLEVSQQRQKKYLKILRKTSTSRIEEIHGFNAYVQKEMKENKKTMYELIHGETQEEFHNGGRQTQDQS